MCQYRCGAHHHVPHTTFSCLHGVRGAGTNGQGRGLAMGKRGQAPSGYRTAVAALPLLRAGPLVCLTSFFFAATGLAKLAYPRDVPLGMVGLALAPPVRTQGGVLSGEGTQPEMAAPGGLRGHAPHPILTHLQMLCGAPRCRRVVIAQLQWGSSSTVCSKIANSLF